MALQIRAGLGLDPWDVFHQGVSDKTGLSFGTIVIITGALVLLAWIPLRQKPGIGTVSNVFVLGIAVDVDARAAPRRRTARLQLALLRAGVVLNGVAGAAYIGAGLGPGPRDGLMTGLVRAHRRLGRRRSAPASRSACSRSASSSAARSASAPSSTRSRSARCCRLLLPSFTIREPVPALA